MKIKTMRKVLIKSTTYYLIDRQRRFFYT